MQTYQALLTIAVFVTTILFFISNVAAIPLSYDTDNDGPSIDELVQLIRRTYDGKRGLDFGLHRGHSGMMTAKYLTGLEMAGPMGPGRKRRSDQQLLNEYSKLNPYRSLYGQGVYFTNPTIYEPSIDGMTDMEMIKRGIDLGFGRGYSGIQQARHLIGIEEANNAMGPGRRRRGAPQTDEQQQQQQQTTSNEKYLQNDA